MILMRKDKEDCGQPSSEYYVKWEGKAHIYNSWVLERRLRIYCSKKLEKFLEKSEEEIEQQLEYLPQWKQPERIVAER